MRPEGEWLVGAEELVTGALEGSEQMCKTLPVGRGVQGGVRESSRKAVAEIQVRDVRLGSRQWSLRGVVRVLRYLEG